MLLLLLNMISAPLTNRGCLSIPISKGPSAAHAGVVAEVGFFFEIAQLLRSLKDRDRASHLCEQSDSLAPRGLSYGTSCHVALL